MRTTKAVFASSPVAHRVFDLLIRVAVRRLEEGPDPMPARHVAFVKNEPNRQ